MSLSKPQQQEGQPSPGSPTKEELAELAARSNAVIEKGLHQLEDEQGGSGRRPVGPVRRPRHTAADLPPPLPFRERRHVGRLSEAALGASKATRAMPTLWPGTKPLGTATSLAAQRAPRDPDGEAYSRTWSEASAWGAVVRTLTSLDVLLAVAHCVESYRFDCCQQRCLVTGGG